MDRNLIKELIKWRDFSARKPLIVCGARQVGKTYLINDFGRRYYDNTVVIDFEKNTNARKIFEGDLDVKKIISLLEIEAKAGIKKHKTLLFFDEIQLCPRALSALRYFYEEAPQVHVIAAGSLLEFEMAKISFPVGRVEFMFMFPMTFEEVLVNMGHENLLAERPGLDSQDTISDYAHQKYLELAKLYSVIGGMPEAVSVYLQTNSFERVAAVHRGLFQSFVQDLLKYEKNLHYESLRDAFESIPKLIGGQIKYSRIVPELSHYKIKQILGVLEKALLIHKIHYTAADGLPLSNDTGDRIFKYLFLDIGLMQHICGTGADILQSQDLLAVYKGAVSEQFVGQEILAHGGSQNGRLFYWMRKEKNSQAEIDYILVRHGEIYPLEVKSGPTGKLKSLHAFLNEHASVKRAYVFSSGNVAAVGKIEFRPFYSGLS